MSYNGSGTFVINSAGQPVVSGTVISSTAFNALTADLATGLSTAITKDGQTTITANIPMANYKFTGLGTGSAAGDSANLSQVQSTAVKLLASVSGADTITAVGSPNVAAYAAGQMFYFVAAGANTGAVTINVDSLGAKNITRDGTTALAAGDIQSGEVCVIVYDGTQFQLVNGASQSAAIVTNSLTVNGTSSLDGAVTINDSGADVDFRVEGDTDANLLFVDASTDNVGFGTNTPEYKTDTVGSTRVAETAAQNGYEVAPGSTNILTSYNRTTSTWLPLRQRANQHEFYCDGVETARLDSAGNLGLGVTPSAWDTTLSKAIQLNGGSLWGYSTSQVNLLQNAFYNTSGDLAYVNTAVASAYRQISGVHSWSIAASGTAGDPITFGDAKMTLDASGNLLVGFTSSYGKLSVNVGSQAPASSGNMTTGVTISNGTGGRALNIGVNDSGGYTFLQSAYVNSAGDTSGLAFFTGPTERARIDTSGNFLVGQTAASGTTPGVILQQTGRGLFIADSLELLYCNRQGSDGTLVEFAHANALEGTISVSGNTVSYNAFAGSHWSQLEDGSKPDILRGTVMESINELCEWPDETNERLPKCKISDTAGSKKVYGVFMAWDNDWTTTNDMYVTAVGAFICRVNADVTVQEGDLLESNGDGTARVQADDIIRSCTIGKVTSTVKTHEYDDGSYCVPTVLYCG